MIAQFVSIVVPIFLISVFVGIIFLVLLFVLDLFLQQPRQYRDAPIYHLLTDLSLFLIPSKRHFMMAFAIPFSFAFIVGIIINANEMISTAQRALDLVDIPPRIPVTGSVSGLDEHATLPSENDGHISTLSPTSIGTSIIANQVDQTPTPEIPTSTVRLQTATVRPPIATAKPPTTTPKPPTATATPKSPIIRLVLINANRDQEIQTLEDGGTVTLRNLNTSNLNVNAKVSSSQIESIIFYLDGEKFCMNDEDRCVENSPPYAMAGDINGDFYNNWDWSSLLGKHTIRAVPCRQDHGKEPCDTPLIVTFTVE